MNNNLSIKICKFYVKGKCTQENCKFVHKDNICRNYFLQAKCKHGDKCKFDHSYKIRKHPKNTTDFKPNHKRCSMNIEIADGNQEKYNKDIYKNDVIIVKNMMQQEENNMYYNQLLKEIEACGIPEDELMKLWHGDTHLIADDKLDWKEKVPTFEKIIKRIEEYFGMVVKSTRFNHYKDTNAWKPFHHDAAAFKPEIAKYQNMTVAISFGVTRDTAFEFNDNKVTLSIPQHDGDVYTFSENVNIEWKHGILQVSPENYEEKGRLSIIAWGFVEQK